LREKSVATTGQ